MNTSKGAKCFLTLELASATGPIGELTWAPAPDHMLQKF